MENINEQQKFSHEEGLKTIYAMIESAKGTIGENYLYYLLWGYLVAATCVIEFILIGVFQFRQHYLVWPVLMGLGLFVSSLFMWRQKRERTHKTFIGHIMGYLWSGWLISFIILLLFVNLMQAPGYHACDHGNVRTGNLHFRRSDQFQTPHPGRINRLGSRCTGLLPDTSNSAADHDNHGDPVLYHSGTPAEQPK